MLNNIVELNPIYVSEDKYKLFNRRLQFNRYLLFNKGMYIKHNNHILYLSNKTDNFSPFTLVLSDEDYIRIINIFNKYDNYNIMINTRSSKIASCKQEQMGKTPAQTSIFFLIDECIKNEEENYILHDILIWLSSCLKLKNKELLERHITDLIGLGEGLTPAYDDMLIGLMWTFDSFAVNFDVIKEAVKEGLKKRNTTAVSYAFYLYAFEKQYSYNLIKLSKAVKEQNFYSMKDIINDIKSCGHTSGKFLLYGISIGLNIIQSTKILLTNGEIIK